MLSEVETTTYFLSQFRQPSQAIPAQGRDDRKVRPGGKNTVIPACFLAGISTHVIVEYKYPPLLTP
mgnify:FL=1